jgi:hypothetical protein
MLCCVGSEPDPTAVAVPDAGVDVTTSTPGDASFDAATVDVAAPDAGAVTDAGGDADGDGGCNPTMPFVSFASMGSVVNAAATDEAYPRLTNDELVMYYSRLATVWITYRVTRAAIGAPWQTPVVFYNTTYSRPQVWPSVDERRAYYAQYDPAATRFQIGRATLGDGGSVVTAGFIQELRGAVGDFAPYLDVDEQAIWFSSARTSGNQQALDIFTARQVDGGFTTPTAVEELNTSANETTPVISSDKRTIYFASARGRSSGSSIWMASRVTESVPFGAAAIVPGLGPYQDEKATVPGSAEPGWISPDDCRLYFATSRDNGRMDLYVASRR